MNTKDRLRRLRPGTILMIVGLAFALVYSIQSSPATPRARHFEADASGHLREVARPSVVAANVPALFKPEPKRLLEHSELKLTESQRKAIAAFQRDWQVEKAELELRMEHAVPKLDARSKSSMSGLNAELGDYSQLSRRYDAARARAWSQALQVLSAEQRSAVR